MKKILQSLIALTFVTTSLSTTVVSCGNDSIPTLTNVSINQDGTKILFTNDSNAVIKTDDLLLKINNKIYDDYLLINQFNYCSLRTPISKNDKVVIKYKNESEINLNTSNVNENAYLVSGTYELKGTVPYVNLTFHNFELVYILGFMKLTIIDGATDIIHETVNDSVNPMVVKLDETPKNKNITVSYNNETPIAIKVA